MAIQDKSSFDPDHDAHVVRQAIDNAAMGNGALLVVSAGAGIGKTTLLNAAVSQGRERGFAVLTAGGSFPERGDAFEVVQRLFACSGGIPASDGQPELHQLHEALRRLAANAPVLVAVDDCQWVDMPSLHWLSTLAWRVRHMPVLVVMSICEGEPCVDEALLDELRASSERELRPQALVAPSAAILIEGILGTTPDPVFLTACMDSTRGNPLLLTALARSLGEHGVAPTAAATASLAEVDLVALVPVIRARLRRLSPHAFVVAQMVAVLGGSATAQRVADMTGIDLAAIAETTDGLRRLGLVRVVGPAVTLTHPILQRLLERQLSYTAMRTTHGQAARLLHEYGVSATDIAEHLLACEPVAEPWALGVLVAAADAALRAADPASAATYLHRALTEPLSAAARVDVIHSLAVAESHVDIATASEHFALAVDGGRAEAADEWAGFLSLTGSVNAAGMYGPQPSGALDVALAEMSLSHATTAGAVVARIRAADRSETTGRTLLTSLLCLVNTWSREPLADIVRLAEAVAAVPIVTASDLRARLRVALVLADAGRLDEAHQHCSSAIDHCDRRHHQPGLAVAYSARSVVNRRRGHPLLAADDARRGLALLAACRADPQSGAVLLARARLIEALIDMGAHDEIADTLARAGQSLGPKDTLAQDLPNALDGAAMLFARGRFAIAAGDPLSGLLDLRHVGERLAAWPIDNPATLPWRSVTAEGLRQIGDVEGARQLAGVEVELAEAWGSAGPLGRALRVLGTVTDNAAGIALLQRSNQVLAGSGWQTEEGLSLIAYGSALRRDGRSDEARPILRNAFELAQQIGSEPLATAARAQHSAAGGRLHRGPRSSPSALSPAEMRVATLAAALRTNREIAATLYVGQRVVEVHLTRCYRKLAISGRAELAAALNASRLLSPRSSASD
jgi:DNA-binding CsgD family transcriptional regulator